VSQSSSGQGNLNLAARSEKRKIGSTLDVELRVGGKLTIVSLDTQSSLSIVSEAFLRRVGAEDTGGEVAPIHFGVGTGMIKRWSVLTVEIGVQKVEIKVAILQDFLVDMVLGYSDLRRMKVAWDVGSMELRLAGHVFQEGDDQVYRLRETEPTEEPSDEDLFLPVQFLDDDLQESKGDQLGPTAQEEEKKEEKQATMVQHVWPEQKLSDEPPEEELDDMSRIDIPPPSASPEEQAQVQETIKERVAAAGAGDQWLQLFLKYRSVFEIALSNPGSAKGAAMAIETTGTPFVDPPRRMSVEKRAVLLSYTQDWLKRKIISPSTSEWACNAHLVADSSKPGGFRVVGDFRGLNARTTADRYPTDSMEDVYQILLKADLVTCLDGTEGYLAIPIQEKDRHKTAIRLPVSMETDGLFQFNVCLFGLRNAGQAYDRWINRIVAGLDSVCSFRDDLFVTTTRRAGETQEAMENRHYQALERCFATVFQQGVRLKPKKIRLLQTAGQGFEALGYFFRNHRMEPKPSSLAAIDLFSLPESVSELRSFMGAVEWLRRFVPSLAKTTLILSEASKMPESIREENDKRKKEGKPLRKNWPLQLGKEAAEAFGKLKLALREVVAVGRFNYDSETYETHIWTDASGFGLGAVLMQRRRTTDTWHVVDCQSRKMTSAERNYIPTEQECLAIYFGVKKWEHWLEGVPEIRVHTDHQALQWLVNSTKIPGRGRIYRWVLFLQDFRLCVDHVRGELNGFADALSRCRAHGELSEAMQDAERVLLHHLGEEKKDEHCEMAEEQKACPEVIAIRHWLANGTLPTGWERKKERSEMLKAVLGKHMDRFSEEGDILWISGREGESRRLVVPISARRDLLRLKHDSVMGGHLGAPKTLELLKPRYWWPRMGEDIREYVQSCPDCQRVKGNWKVPGDLSPGPITAPFEHIHIDLMGPLPETVSGNKYIMSVVDRSTKRVDLLAIPNKEARTIAWELVSRIICWYGSCPSSIQTDQGTEFVNQVVRNVTNLLGINHVRGAAYHPQTNGMVERMNLPVQRILATFGGIAQNIWDQYLPFAMFAINNSVSASTGETPNYLVFGRRGFDPADQVFGLTQPQLQALSSEKWLRRLEEARRIAAQHQEISQQTMKERFDKDKEKHSYGLGDRVWVLEMKAVPGKSAKLRPKASSVIYLVKELTGGNQKHAHLVAEDNPRDIREVHVDRLQHVRDEPKGLFGEDPNPAVPADSASKEDVFTVERVLDVRTGKDGELEYQVRWLGYGAQDDTWQKREDLAGAQELLAEFERDAILKQVARPKLSYAEAVKKPSRKEVTPAKSSSSTGGKSEAAIPVLRRAGPVTRLQTKGFGQRGKGDVGISGAKTNYPRPNLRKQ
jgi:RNase H-like domain found in reverse transcriptase/Integrase zinc binding domain/Chromo (CHRromatin Organisation MOdifier) domain/Integrase core domain/Reverse transcriptase (RNA-dependent DNA polymerase)